jgi:hypothetical protein
VHEELKRRGVTLMILWEEHRAEHVDGHGYSRFCEPYGETPDVAFASECDGGSVHDRPAAERVAINPLIRDR